MKILMIIDSLELNGGSTMFLEMLQGFREYYPAVEISGLVVSKTGFFGREKLVNEQLMASYGETLKSMNYDDFYANKRQICDKNTIILHHRLGCTRPLHVNNPYIVINHTVETPHRLEQFKHALRIISVCRYIQKITGEYANSLVILNGVENKFIKSISPAKLEGKFRTGRCTRLSPSKFRLGSLEFLEKLALPGHVHHLMGPSSNKNKAFDQFKSTKYWGPIFDRHVKLAILKSFHLYFYDSPLKEGASMAILESLACGVPVMCRPRGGNTELIIDNLNGFHIDDDRRMPKMLISLHRDPSKLEKMRTWVKKDFEERLHIKHMLAKYMSILRKFE